jgi:hypothetical protein
MNERGTTRPWIRVFAVAAGGAAVVVLGLFVRLAVAHWTRARIEQSLVRQIAALEENDAAALVLGFDSHNQRAIPALAFALADPRPAVAEAAQHTIGRLIADWQLLPAGEAAPRVASLAQHLAAHGNQVALRRRAWLRDLAARLLVWPIPSQSDLSVATIAQCEAILRLPLPTEADLRIAARPNPPEAEEPAFPAHHPAALAPPLPQPLPLAEAALPTAPRDSIPHDLAEPSRLPGASRELPLAPRQFLAPRARKLSPP